MAQYDIIGGIVDPKALQELKDLEAIASKIGKSLKGVTLGGISSEADLALVKRLNAETDLLIKKTEQYNTSVQRGAKLTMEQKVAQQALNNEAKLNATVTSQQTTALQKMYAQMKLLEIEMQSKFNPALKEQSAEFQALSKQHANLQQEYARTSRATGVMGRQMNSMYGSTFQLTQVMRELPNFAIDARIGFMSLSNNLPMLIDSFKILKQQIIDTEGAAGATRKTWAAFGKSLLSLNTIMIVASTLLILFGDDIVNFVGKLFTGEKQIDRTSESLKQLISVMKDYDGQAAKTIGNVQKLGVEIEKYGDDSKYTKTIIDEFNTTFGTHLKSINAVKEAYPLMAKEAIDAAVKLQASSKIIDMGARGTLMSMESQNILSRIPSKRKQEATTMVDKLFNQAKNEGLTFDEITTRLIEGRSPFDTFLGQNIYNKLSNEDLAVWFENPDNLRLAQLLAQQRKGEKLTKLAEQELAKILPPPIVKPDKPNGGYGTSEKTGKEFIVDLKDYAKEREAIIRNIAKTEVETERENTEGQINTYDERRMALKELYQYKENLLQLDLETAQKNENEKYVNDVKAIKDRLQSYLANDKISAKRKEELTNSANEAIRKLTENHNNEMFRLEQEYQTNSENLIIDSAKKKLSIDKEAYEEDARLLHENLDYKLRIIEENYQKQVSAMNLMSAGEILLSGLGLSIPKYEDMQDVVLKQNANTQKLQSEIDYTKSLMNLKNISGEQLQKLSIRLAEQEMLLTEQQKTDKLELDRLFAKKEQDIQVEITKQTVQLLQTVWDSYYEVYYKKLDEERNRVSKIETEKQKEIEDKEKAGVITKQEAEEQKARTSDYYASVQADIDKKQEDAERNKFLLQQASTIAQIWLQYVLTSAAYNKQSSLFPALAPLYQTMKVKALYEALIGTGIAAAQSIPYFAEGGDMLHSGLAVLGDGGKKELAISPSGKYFISDDKPTMYQLEKGTHIYPDINKLDLASVLAMKQAMPEYSNNAETIAMLKSIDRGIKKQKSGNFYGMPLVRQIENKNRFSNRNRSLMN